MAIAVQMDYTVDLCKPVHLIQMDVPFFTGDKNAHRFHVKLVRDGCDVDTTGMTATGCMVRADNQTVIWDGEVDGCDIYLTMPASCYAVAGRFRLLLKVELDEIKETALWVEGFVTNSSTDTIVDPGTTLWSIEEVLAKLDKLEREMGEMSDLDVDDVDGAVSRTEFDALVSGLPVLIGSEEGKIITLTDSAEGRIVDLKLYGTTTQNGMPTLDAPVPLVNAGAGESIVVKSQGKNLWNGEIGAQTATAIYNFENGTATFYRDYGGIQAFVLSETKFPAGAYTISFDYTHADTADLELRISDELYTDDLDRSTVLSRWYVNEKVRYTFTMERDSHIGFCTNANAVTITLANMQLEIGSTATTYEPHMDGGTMIASTPGGLAGLPVDGCAPDLIDFGAGLVVRNVYVLDAASVAWNLNGVNHAGDGYIFYTILYGTLGDRGMLSNRFRENRINASGSWDVLNVGEATVIVDNGGDLAYVILCMPSEINTVDAINAYFAANSTTFRCLKKTPLITPISEDELAAFRTMRTFKPTSTIYNDAGAPMRIDYVADTKNYIDQRISAMLKV